MSATNAFSVLSTETTDFVPSKSSKKSTSKNMDGFVPVSKTAQKSVLQDKYPYVLFLKSSKDGDEFFIYKTKISSKMRLNSDATLTDLNNTIDKMGLPYPCYVWATVIDFPEMMKFITNQSTFPYQYHYLQKQMCGKEVNSVPKQPQHVMILDFRYPNVKGKEFIYLPDHKKFYFGTIRHDYVTKKAEVFGLKKYYMTFCEKFKFEEVDKLLFEAHQYVLLGSDSEWIEFRETQIRLLKDAASVFDSSDYDVFDRFPNIEELKKEINMAYLFKDELLERLPKMRLEYDRKMVVEELYNDKDAFPSL